MGYASSVSRRRPSVASTSSSETLSETSSRDRNVRDDDAPTIRNDRPANASPPVSRCPTSWRVIVIPPTAPRGSIPTAPAPSSETSSRDRNTRDDDAPTIRNDRPANASPPVDRYPTSRRMIVIPPTSPRGSIPTAPAPSSETSSQDRNVRNDDAPTIRNDRPANASPPVDRCPTSRRVIVIPPTSPRGSIPTAPAPSSETSSQDRNVRNDDAPTIRNDRPANASPPVDRCPTSRRVIVIPPTSPRGSIPTAPAAAASLLKIIR